MTKKERARLEEAVKLLYADDKWDEAMVILFGLLGRPYPLAEWSGQPISICDIPKQDQDFIFRR